MVGPKEDKASLIAKDMAAFERFKEIISKKINHVKPEDIRRVLIG